MKKEDLKNAKEQERRILYCTTVGEARSVRNQIIEQAVKYALSVAAENAVKQRNSAFSTASRIQECILSLEEEIIKDLK